MGNHAALSYLSLLNISLVSHSFECELVSIIFNLDPNMRCELFRSKYFCYEEK